MEDRLKQPLDEDRRVTGLKGWIRVHFEYPWASERKPVMVNLRHVWSVEPTPSDSGPEGALISVGKDSQITVIESFEQVVILMELAS